MAKISNNIYSIDGLEILFPGHGVIPYLVEEGYNDLTLIDTCYIKELPKLESYLNSISYEMSDIKRIILTHAHAHHVQAANEVKKRTYLFLRRWSKDIFSLDRFSLLQLMTHLIMAHRILEFTRSY